MILRVKGLPVKHVTRIVMSGRELDVYKGKDGIYIPANGMLDGEGDGGLAYLYIPNENIIPVDDSGGEQR